MKPLIPILIVLSAVGLSWTRTAPAYAGGAAPASALLPPSMPADAAAQPPAAPVPPALNLSAAQQQRLTSLHAASHAQSEQLYSQLRQATDQLFQLYDTYGFDPRDARRLNQEINHVQGELLDLRLSEQQQLRDILSADQFAQLEATVHSHAGWDDSSPNAHGHDHHHGAWSP